MSFRLDPFVVLTRYALLSIFYAYNCLQVPEKVNNEVEQVTLLYVCICVVLFLYLKIHKQVIYIYEIFMFSLITQITINN